MSQKRLSVNLQVTIYGRARLGHDVFLGEVVIPLREVESMADSSTGLEMRRYILGRRNAKEKVICMMVSMLQLVLS